MAKSPRSANTMQIGLRVFREVKINDNVHRWDVNTTGQQISAHEIPAAAVAEIMENTISVLLSHA